MMLLCRDAQAASWRPRGRETKYFTDSASGIFVAHPVMTTWRSRRSHGNRMETFGFSPICRDLRLSRLVKKTKPRRSRPLSSTVRTNGLPSLPAVAGLIAVGYVMPARHASSSHSWNCSIGSALRFSRRNRAAPVIDPQIRKIHKSPSTEVLGYFHSILPGSSIRSIKSSFLGLRR